VVDTPLVLVRQGNFEDAPILLAKASSLAPPTTIAFHYAMALKGKGLQAKAKEAVARRWLDARLS